jgi:[ribosomal protein S5]-alanine N-acetyltransferase
MVMNMKHKDIEIVTPRLILRVPEMKDAEELNAAMNNVWHELQLWMSWAHNGENTLEKTKSYIQSVNESESENIPLIGFCRETGKFAVSTGLMKRGDIYETGYWVAKDFLGKGYATEAAIATILYAFDVLKTDAVFINYFEGNEKSRKIIEKLGFRKIGILKQNHSRCYDDVLMDEHQYKMNDPSVLPPLEVEWRQRCP